MNLIGKIVAIQKGESFYELGWGNYNKRFFQKGSVFLVIKKYQKVDFLVYGNDGVFRHTEMEKFKQITKALT